MKLHGLNTLITGASQGLGQAIARQFLTEGANVLICARSPGPLAAARDHLSRFVTPQQRVLAKQCDVSDETQVSSLVSFALSELGSIHVLVNNAGIYGPMGPTESVPWEDWKNAIEINLYGALHPTRALTPQFKKAQAGKIIFISGGGATNPLPNISSYAASKAAVVRLMETIALELKPFHVDVNAIAPGALKTRFVDQVLQAGPEVVGESFYAKNKKWAEEGATPLELGASLAVYLASNESNGLSGKLISAQWDPWQTLHQHQSELSQSDIYCLRRIVPEDRGKNWQNPPHEV